jgi:hypothetical protein
MISVRAVILHRCEQFFNHIQWNSLGALVPGLKFVTTSEAFTSHPALSSECPNLVIPWFSLLGSAVHHCSVVIWCWKESFAREPWLGVGILLWLVTLARE